MFNIIIYIIIALLYNFFVHNLASVMYKDLQFDEKQSRTIMLIMIFGCVGIVVGKLYEPRNKFAGNGLILGGIFLLLTVLINYWSSIDDSIKLFGTAGLLILAAYFGKTYGQPSLEAESS